MTISTSHSLHLVKSFWRKMAFIPISVCRRYVIKQRIQNQLSFLCSSISILLSNFRVSILEPRHNILYGVLNILKTIFASHEIKFLINQPSIHPIISFAPDTIEKILLSALKLSSKSTPRSLSSFIFFDFSVA